MTESVSDNDVEDVLSSIRRLVSNDPDPKKKPAPDQDAAADKLLLTPAFRKIA